jgi:glycosyltransferase involved in cell wall biosynthesis
VTWADEIIVVDDCSSEDIGKLVETINSSKIRILKHDLNRGTPAARNTGIKLSGSKYIAFLDNDDEWMPDKLEKQIALIEEETSETGIIDTGYINKTHDKSYYVPCYNIRNSNAGIYGNIIRKYFLLPSTMLLKRECFSKAGLFDENFVMFDDWDLFLTILKYYSIKGINEPLVKRYVQPDSVSINIEIALKGYSQLFHKHYPEIKRDKKLLSVCLLKLGQMSCFQGIAGNGRAYLLKSIKANPLEFRAYIAYLLSFLGNTIYRGFTSIYRAVVNLLKIS